MTTVRQVREVVKPLLERNPDLALVGRLIVIKPVHHILRGIYIDRMSIPNVFRPTWATVFLFEPDAHFTFNWGGQIYSTLEGLWTSDNPLTPIAMCEAIEKVALPLLRPVQSIMDFVAFTTQERFPSTPLNFYKRHKIFVDLALGDFESAREICAHYAMESTKDDRKGRKLAKWETKWLAWEKEVCDYMMGTVCPLVAAEDKIGIARLLHNLEAEAVKKQKLHKLWKRTPFPIELGV